MSAECLEAKPVRASGAWIRLQAAFRHWGEGLPLRFQRPVRRLKLHERLVLGEKCFVAVVGYEDRRFLVGGNANSFAVVGEVSVGNAFAQMLERLQPERMRP